MQITGKKIVEQARTWLGTKYHHQGRLKKADTYRGGIDCIGLVMGVAEELEIKGANNKPLKYYDRFDYSAIPDGKSLPEFLDKHLIKKKYKNKKSENNKNIFVKTLSAIKLGDILLFKLFQNPQHVGIVSRDAAGNIGIIHCYSGSGMVVEHLLSPAWVRMIVGCYRFSKK